MPSNFPLSQRMLTNIFWEHLLSFDEDRSVEKRGLSSVTIELEALIEEASYKTGSVNFSAAWCLYSLVRFFKVQRCIEVGTFIGKSTISILTAMDHTVKNGEVYTCDFSNDIQIPWTGTSKLKQFPMASSTQLLQKVEGKFDFVFLDGRLQEDDLPLLEAKITQETIIALDDFEGYEKGVINYANLSKLHKLGNHVLIYPASEALLKSHALTTHSVTAVMLPVSLISVTKQG
jgi:hypothetical protein